VELRVRRDEKSLMGSLNIRRGEDDGALSEGR
jgi:hypothetical protein